MKIKKKSVGWDASHLEFTIEDHYYFSRLKSCLIENGVRIEEVRVFSELENYDTIVINYPEIPFQKDEVDFLALQAEKGKRIVVTGYYNNEDNISHTINTVSEFFGARMNSDQVIDNEHNDCLDPLLPVTDNITLYNRDVNDVMLPCCATISVTDERAEPFILNKTGTDSTYKILGTVTKTGKGEFLLIGSCVFWDNHAILKYSNMSFALNLLIS